MPQWVDDDDDSEEEHEQQHVPGVYAALLQQTRVLYDSPQRWDPRWKHLQHPHNPISQWCGSPGVVCEHDPPPPEYRDQFTRLRLDELEAGQPVTVAADEMPPGTAAGDGARAYRVGSDDVVVPRS